MKVALIDKAINYKSFIAALKSDIYPIFIEDDDSFPTLIDKINNLNHVVTNIVIAQHSNEKGIIIGGERPIIYSDSASWNGLKEFLLNLSKIGVETVDFLACLLYAQPGVPEMLSELESLTGIDLRASTNDTGNVEVGGDWILESDMVNIEDLYFTEKIENFKDLFVQVQFGIETTTNGSQAYPTPYGNWYFGSREEYLILASELFSQGIFIGSNITQIKFNVVNVNSCPSLQNYTIRIGTTSLTNLSIGPFITGLTEVFNSILYTPFTGINTHTFTVPYIYNGGNIVISTCFNNTNYVNNGNASVALSTTLFNSYSSCLLDSQGVCAQVNSTAVSSTRPNIYFEYTPPHGTHPIPTNGAVLGTVNLEVYSSHPGKYSIRNGTLINVPIGYTYVTDLYPILGDNSYYGIANINGIDVSYSYIITPRAPELTVISDNGAKLIVNAYSGENIIIQRSSDGIAFAPVTTEISGNIYIDKTARTDKTYYYKVSATSPTSRTVFTSFVKSVYIKSHAPEWLSFIDGASAENGRRVAVDLCGNSYIVGETSSTAGIILNNGITYTRPASISTSATLGFIVKYNSDGIAQWLYYLGAPVGTATAGYAYGVSTDTQGFVYITGDYNIISPTASLAIVDVSNSLYTAPLKFNTSQRVFVIKLNPTNASMTMTSRIVWFAWIQSTSTTTLYNNLVLDKDNNVLVTGSLNAPTGLIRISNTDYPALLPTGVAQSGIAGFVAKLNGSSGNAMWFQRIDANGSADYGFNITCDSSGNAFVTGYVSAPTSGFITVADLSYNTLLPTGVAQSGTAAFVAKLNSSSGNAMWFQRIDANGSTDIGYGIACDSSGNAFVTGYVSAPTSGFITVADLSYNTLLPTGVAQSGTAAFVAKLNSSSGNAMWFQRIDAIGTDIGYGIACDSLGNAFVTGYVSAPTSGFITVVDLSYNTLLPTGIAQLNNSIFIAKLNGSSGSAMWFERIDSTNNDFGYDIQCDSNDNLYVTGVLSQTTSLITLENGRTFAKPSAAAAAFILKYKNIGAIYPGITITNGDLGKVVIGAINFNNIYTLYKNTEALLGYIDISNESIQYTLDSSATQIFYIKTTALIDPFIDICSNPVSFTPRSPSITLSDSNVFGNIVISVNNYNAPYKLYRNEVFFGNYFAADTTITVPAETAGQQNFYIIATSSGGIPFTSPTVSITPRPPSITLSNSFNLGQIDISVNNYNIPYELYRNGVTFGNFFAADTTITVPAISGDQVNFYIVATSSGGIPFTSPTVSITPRPPSITLSNSFNLGQIDISVNNYNAPYILYRNGVTFGNFFAADTTITVPAISGDQVNFYVVATSSGGIPFTSPTVSIIPRPPSFTIQSAFGGKIILIATLYNGIDVFVERSNNNISYEVISVEISGNNYIDSNPISGTSYYKITAKSPIYGIPFTSNPNFITINLVFSGINFVDLKEFAAPEQGFNYTHMDPLDRKVFVGDTGIYVCGSYIGDLSARYPGLTNVGTKVTAFLVKLTTSGTFVWAKQITGGSVAYSIAYQLSVIENSTSDKNGIYVSGVYEGLMPPYLLSSGDWANAFVMRFDLDGNLGWARRIDGTFQDAGSCIHATTDGIFGGFNIFNNNEGAVVVYMPDGTAMRTITGLSTANRNIVIIRFNHDGSISSQMNPIVIPGLAYDSNLRSVYVFENDLFFCGTVQGNYTTPTYPFTFSSSGSYSGILLKYSITGTFLNVRRIIGSSGANINSIAVNSTGIYMSGHFESNVTSDSEFTSIFTTTTGQTGFIAKLNNDSTLSFAWAKKFEQASLLERAISVAIGDTGVFVSLCFSSASSMIESSKIGSAGTVTSATILSNEFTANNGASAYVKYDFDGTRLYTQKTYDSTAYNDLGTSISSKNGIIAQGAIRNQSNSQDVAFFVSIYSESIIRADPLVGNGAFAFLAETFVPTESTPFTFGYYSYNGIVYTHLYNQNKTYSTSTTYQIFLTNNLSTSLLSWNDTRYGGILASNTKTTLTLNQNVTVSANITGYLLFNSQTFESIIISTLPSTTPPYPTDMVVTVNNGGEQYSLFKNDSVVPLVTHRLFAYIDTNTLLITKYTANLLSGKTQSIYYGKPFISGRVNATNERTVDLSFNYAGATTYDLYKNGLLLLSNETALSYNDSSTFTSSISSYYIVAKFDTMTFTSDTILIELILPSVIANIHIEYGKAYVSLINYSATANYDILGSYDNLNFDLLASQVSGEAIINVPTYEGTYYIKAFIENKLNEVVPVKLTISDPSIFTGGTLMTYNKNGSIYDSNRGFPRLTSVPLLENKKIIKYAYTSTSYATIDASGFVYCWGSQGSGGSGIPDAIQVCLSGSNLPISNIIDVYANGAAFAAVDNSGKVYIWGTNTNGGSGLVTVGSIRCIELLLNTTNLPITNVKNIYATQSAFAALDNSGQVYIWGTNTNGGSGLVTVGSIRCIELLLNTTNLPITNIMNIYATQSAFAALDNSGKVYIWGNGSFGGSGLVTVGSIKCIEVLLNTTNLAITNIMSIYSNASAFAALDNSGKAFIWGAAANGGSGIVALNSIRCIELLLNTTSTPITNVTNIYATFSAFAALDNSGRAYIWGTASNGGSGLVTAGSIRCIEVLLNTTGSAITNIKNIYATQNSFAALDNSGQVYGWGAAFINLITVGQISATNLKLENQTIINDIIDVKITPSAFFFIGKTGYYSWGLGNQGGSGFTYTNFLYGYKLDTYENYNMIISLNNSNDFNIFGKTSIGFGIITENRTYLLGTTTSGHISNLSYQLPFNNVNKIFTTGQSFAALTNNGEVYVWNASTAGGSHPSGTFLNANSPILRMDISGEGPLNNIKYIYATGNSFAALDNSGQVYIWGSVNGGGSGLTGSINPFISPKCIRLQVNTDAILNNIKAITPTALAFAALDNSGKVYIWGTNTSGGSGLTTLGSIRCIELLSNTTNLPIRNIKNIYANSSAFAALDNSGNTYIWGAAAQGGSGLVTVGSIRCIEVLLNTTNLPIRNIKNIYPNGSAFAALDSLNNIYIWGASGNGGSGLVTVGSIRCIEVLLNTTNLPIRNIKNIYANSSAFAALDNSGNTYIWGAAAQGGSGLITVGSIRCIELLLNTTNLSLTNINDIFYSNNAFAALDNSGKVYIWGASGNGGSGLSTVGSIRCISLELFNAGIITNINKIYSLYKPQGSFTNSSFSATDGSGNIYSWGEQTAGGSGLTLLNSVRAIKINTYLNEIVNDTYNIYAFNTGYMAVGTNHSYIWGGTAASQWTTSPYIYATRLNNPFTATISATALTIPNLQTKNLYISSYGGALPYRFEWYKDETLISTDKNPIFAITNYYNAPTNPISSTYKVKLTDAANISIDLSATVTFGSYAPLTASITPSTPTITIPYNESRTLSISGENGSFSYTYEWLEISGGENVVVSSQQQITLTNNTQNEDIIIKEYIGKITDAIGFDITFNITVIFDKYLGIIASTLNPTITLDYNNGRGELLVDYVRGGQPQYSYFWFEVVNGVEQSIPGLTNRIPLTNNYTYYNQADVTKYYRCNIKDVNNNETPVNFTATYKAYPELTAFADLSSVTINFNNDSKTLKVIDVSGGKPDYSFIWYEISGQTSIPISSNSTELLLNNNYVYYKDDVTIQYRCAIIDNANNPKNVEFTVTYKAYPAIVIIYNTEPVIIDIESSGNLVVQSVAGGTSSYIYSWYSISGENTGLIKSGEDLSLILYNFYEYVQSDVPTTYRFEARDSKENFETVDFIVTFKAYNFIAKQNIRNATLYPNELIRLGIDNIVGGIKPYTFEWYTLSGNTYNKLNNQSNSSLYIDNNEFFKGNDRDNIYKGKIIDFSNNFSEFLYGITLKPHIQLRFEINNDSQIDFNEQLTIKTIALFGTPPFNFQWYKNDVAIYNSNIYTITIINDKLNNTYESSLTFVNKELTYDAILTTFKCFVSRA